MLLIKKLVFALPFLLLLAGFVYQLNFFLGNPSIFLSLNTDILAPTGFLLGYLLLSALFFITFTTLAQNWKLSLPVILVAAGLPFLILSSPFNFILAGSLIFALIVISYSLDKKLRSYLTFQANNLLLPSIKQLVTLVILISSLLFYFAASLEIKENGFKLPDSLLDTALQFMPQTPEVGGPEGENLDLGSMGITPQQLELLKQNPDLLRQYGLDPSILELVNNQPKGKTTKITTQDLVKPMLQSQMDSIIKPYLDYIPLVLTVLFFFSLQSSSSLLSIILSPLLGYIFWILEKTGFTKYQTEMREVKKLVV